MKMVLDDSNVVLWNQNNLRLIQRVSIYSIFGVSYLPIILLILENVKIV